MRSGRASFAALESRSPTVLVAKVSYGSSATCKSDKVCRPSVCRSSTKALRMLLNATKFGSMRAWKCLVGSHQDKGNAVMYQHRGTNREGTFCGFDTAKVGACS
jgi:hypothetical protein